MSESDMRAYSPPNLEKPVAAAEAAIDNPVDMEALREAFVQKNFQEKYKSYFDAFDRDNKKFKPGFCWPAFFLGPFWYLYRKMYLIAAVLVAFFIVFSLMLESISGRSHLGIGVGISAGLAMMARTLYINHVQNKIKKASELYPQDPAKAKAWLRASGGANLWLPIVLAVLVFLTVSGLILIGMGAVMSDPELMQEIMNQSQ